jgi:signal transduction histidine kinase
MDNIYEEINCVESLIDTALSYASISNYNKIFSPQKQYISTWFDEQIDIAVKGSKNIQFIKNYDSNLGWVYMDMNLMERVLSNLLGNAKKYTKNIVQVSVTRTEETLTFSVEDNGKGVPPEEVEKVFKPFYRGKGNKKLGIRGFGLGLTIVYKIVDLHRGTVHVKTSELGGASFVVELPCDYQHQ